jgi:hypothetical protein
MFEGIHKTPFLEVMFALAKIIVKNFFKHLTLAVTRKMFVGETTAKPIKSAPASAFTSRCVCVPLAGIKLTRDRFLAQR